MTTLPCEYAHWHLVPMIRRELAICLVEVFELTQSEAARKLDLTPAAVSQYFCGKRGNNGGFDEQLKYEVAYSAGHIKKHGRTVVQSEICRLCFLIRKKSGES